MILMIDNYDSFTYNLVQYLGELGAEVETVRNDAVTIADIIAMKPEGIVISPGPCTPNEAGICLEVVRGLGPTYPLLGVCLGHQCIGQAFGGEGGAGRAHHARQDLDDLPPPARACSPGCRSRSRRPATTRWCWSPIPFPSACR
jgi:anthranilate synthase/aminodeoxychorismate synthase-like glutamine amidotransferase